MIIVLGKYEHVKSLFDSAIDAGYGNIPFPWCIKLYLHRN